MLCNYLKKLYNWSWLVRKTQQPPHLVACWSLGNVASKKKWSFWLLSTSSSDLMRFDKSRCPQRNFQEWNFNHGQKSMGWEDFPHWTYCGLAVRIPSKKVRWDRRWPKLKLIFWHWRYNMQWTLVPYSKCWSATVPNWWAMFGSRRLIQLEGIAMDKIPRTFVFLDDFFALDYICVSSPWSHHSVGIFCWICSNNLGKIQVILLLTADGWKYVKSQGLVFWYSIVSHSKRGACYPSIHHEPRKKLVLSIVVQ